jgi:hypothetical protein
MTFDYFRLHALAPGRARSAAALSCALAVFAAAVFAHAWSRSARQDEAIAARDLRFRLAAARKMATPVSAPMQDFAQSLPVSVSVDKLVQTLQESAQAFNVALVNVSSEPRAETAQALPRLEINITLKGAYPALKSTLAEALDRFPNAVIEQLGMKRDSAGLGTEEMTVRVALLLRPGMAR